MSIINIKPSNNKPTHTIPSYTDTGTSNNSTTTKIPTMNERSTNIESLDLSGETNTSSKPSGWEVASGITNQDGTSTNITNISNQSNATTTPTPSGWEVSTGITDINGNSTNIDNTTAQTASTDSKPVSAWEVASGITNHDGKPTTGANNPTQSNFSSSSTSFSSVNSTPSQGGMPATTNNSSSMASSTPSTGSFSGGNSSTISHGGETSNIGSTTTQSGSYTPLGLKVAAGITSQSGASISTISNSQSTPIAELTNIDPTEIGDITSINSKVRLSLEDYLNLTDYVDNRVIYSRHPMSYSDLIKTEEFQNIISNLGLDINGLQTYEDFHNYMEGQKIEQLGTMLEYIGQVCSSENDSISFLEYQESEEFNFFVKQFKLGQDHFDSLDQFQTYINQYATEDKITQINESLTTFKTERDNFYTEVSDALGEDFDGMITQYNNDINSALMTSEGNFANLIERIRNGYRVTDSEELEWVANVIYLSLNQEDAIASANRAAEGKTGGDANATYYTLEQIKMAISDSGSNIDFEDIYDLYIPASQELLKKYDPTLIENIQTINNIYDKKLNGIITGPNGETLSFNDCLTLKQMYDQNIIGLETSLQDAKQTVIQLQYQVIMQSNDYQNYDYFHYDDTKIDIHGAQHVKYSWDTKTQLSPIDYIYYLINNTDMTEEEFINGEYTDFQIMTGSARQSGDYIHNDIEDLRNLIEASKYDESLIKMYNYIYYTEGLEAANKYIYDTENNVNETLAQVYVQESLKNLKPGQPIVIYDEVTGEKTEIELEVSNGKLIVKGLGDGVSQFFSGVGGWFNQDTNKTVFEWEQYYFALALMTPEQKIEAGLIDENGKSTSPFIDFTKDYSQGGISSIEYNISSSIGNMLPSMALSAVNPMLGSTAMAIGAGGNSYRDAYTSGYDLEKSLTYGMISGISEAALERMLGSIPGLGKESETVIPSMSKWIMSCWDEGKEEFVQEGFDIMLKNVLFGEEVKLEDAIQQMGVAGLYGAATGGIMNGVQMTGTAVKLNINNTESNIRLVLENNNEALNNSQIAEMFGVTEQDIVNISNKISKENSSNTRITNNPDGKLRIGEAALTALSPSTTETKTDSTGFEINEFGEVIRGEKESSQPHDDDITYFEPPSETTADYADSSPFLKPAGDLTGPSSNSTDTTISSPSAIDPISSSNLTSESSITSEISLDTEVSQPITKLTEATIETIKTNKDGEHLTIERIIESTEKPVGNFYKTSTRYDITNSNGEYIGSITASILNVNESNSIELEYWTEDGFEGKGNASAALDEVIRDIFVNETYDNFRTKDKNPLTQIDTIILSISEDNYASQRVAEKAGFKRIGNTTTYELTKSDFLARQTIDTSTDTSVDKLTDEEVTKKYSLSQKVQDFFQKNGIDISEIYNMQEIKTMPAAQEIDGKVMKKTSSVNIGDILGFEGDDTTDVLEIFSQCFSENNHYFQGRSLGLLEYTSEDIISKLTDSFERDPIVLSKTKDGQYIITENGRHRYSILKMFYLSELSQATTQQEIDVIKQKYTIPVKIITEDTFCSSLSQIIKQNNLKYKEVTRTEEGLLLFKGEKEKVIGTDKFGNEYTYYTIKTLTLTEQEAIKYLENSFPNADKVQQSIENLKRKTTDTQESFLTERDKEYIQKSIDSLLFDESSYSLIAEMYGTNGLEESKDYLESEKSKYIEKIQEFEEQRKQEIKDISPTDTLKINNLNNYFNEYIKTWQTALEQIESKIYSLDEYIKNSEYNFFIKRNSNMQNNSKSSIFINENGLIDAKLLPLSTDEATRVVQQKVLNNEPLTIAERLKLRDNAVTKIGDVELYSDHMYRATSIDAVNDYINKGYISDDGGGKGYAAVNWYLGGTSTRYGKVIVEVAADPNNFELSDNYGGFMSGNPNVRQAHSSNTNPISTDNISRILFLSSDGSKILKIIDPKTTTNLSSEIELGGLIQEQEILTNQKNKQGENFPAEKLTELDRINEKIGNIQVQIATDTIESMDVKQINDYLTENNFDTEITKQIINSLPGEVLSRYVIETIEDPRTRENIEMFDSNNIIKNMQFEIGYLQKETINLLKEKINNPNYQEALGTYFEEERFALSEVYNYMITIPELVPFLREDIEYFNSYISKIIDNNFDTTTELFKGLDSSELSEYITAGTINDMSEETRLKFEQKYPGVIDEIINKINYSPEDIIKDKYSETYKRFLDYDNNKIYFGNKEKSEYINKIYQFLISDEAFNTYKINIDEYLEIDGLRELLLQNDKVIKYMSEYYNPKIFTKYLENDYFYSRIDKNSNLYKEYINKVMSGNEEFNISRLTDIINGYRNQITKSDITPEIELELIKYISNETILTEFKNRTEELNQDQLQRLIDFLSVYELLDSQNLSLDDTITLEEYNSMYNYINKVLLENNNAIDLAHYQSNIYNFSKYYALLNGLEDVDVKFYYEDNKTGGTSSGGKVRFNTKFFTNIFKSENIYMDKLETIFHEYFHEMQNQEYNIAIESINNSEGSLKSTINKYSLIYTIDQLLRDISNSYYKNNYKNIFIEIDARYNSFILLKNYLKEISPNTYEKYLNYLTEKINSDQKLYEQNSNVFDYKQENLTLNRDAFLDRLMKENPTKYLKDYPLLNFIYNTDGTRKTIFELEQIKQENINDTNIVNMINYWIRNSKFSLDSLINELYTLIKNSTSEYKSYKSDLIDKSIETILIESNYLTDPNFETRITEILNNLINNHPNNIEEIETTRKNILDIYNLCRNNASYIILNQGTDSIKQYLTKNINEESKIRDLINLCSYEQYIEIVNMNIDGLAPYLCEQKAFFNEMMKNNFNKNFDIICEWFISKINPSEIKNIITSDHLLLLSEENREKFEQRYPGVIAEIMNESAGTSTTQTNGFYPTGDLSKETTSSTNNSFESTIQNQSQTLTTQTNNYTATEVEESLIDDTTTNKSDSRLRTNIKTRQPSNTTTSPLFYIPGDISIDNITPATVTKESSPAAQQTKVTNVGPDIQTQQFQQYKNLDKFFTDYKTLYGNYGCNQGQFTHLNIEKFNEYIKVKRLLIKEYGFSPKDARHLMKIIDGQGGACVYTRGVNSMIEFFKNYPQEFEEDFGFPLFITDEKGITRINDIQLYLDYYCYSNIIAGEKGNWKRGRVRMRENGELYINYDPKTSFQDGGAYDQLADYINYKTNRFNLQSSEFGFDNATPNEIREELLSRIQKGEQLSLGGAGYTLTSPTATYEKIGGHWIKITDITDTGIVVSSWGEKFTISFEDIAGLEYGNEYMFISDVYSVNE